MVCGITHGAWHHSRCVASLVVRDITHGAWHHSWHPVYMDTSGYTGIRDITQLQASGIYGRCSKQWMSSYRYPIYIWTLLWTMNVQLQVSGIYGRCSKQWMSSYRHPVYMDVVLNNGCPVTGIRYNGRCSKQWMSSYRHPVYMDVVLKNGCPCYRHPVYMDVVLNNGCPCYRYHVYMAAVLNNERILRFIHYSVKVKFDFVLPRSKCIC